MASAAWASTARLSISMTSWLNDLRCRLALAFSLRCTKSGKFLMFRVATDCASYSLVNSPTVSPPGGIPE